MNYPFYRRLICLIVCSSLLIRCNLPAGDATAKKVLVFTKTLEYRHQSIDDGIKMLEKLGKENHFRIEVSEDASLFNDDSLKQFNAIVFLSRMDDDHNYIGMEPFAPEAHFSSITDMKFGPDGLLYVLEYGKTWYQHNEDAGISRIIYSPKK